ncbi:MAG: DUF4038 domain-containing protein [Verrucomicrobiota bacterium]
MKKILFFICSALLTVMATEPGNEAAKIPSGNKPMNPLIVATAKQVTEWSYTSGKPYKDPFNEVELDVVFTHSSGKSWRVPTYWAGGLEWRVRFAPPLPGTYEAVSLCSDEGNQDLHQIKHHLDVSAYEGDNPLLKHGNLRVASSKRTFEYEDGTPFFWMGDTWWMALCKRLSWPEDFQLLTADRKSKGFSVIQIVAGLYPDMPEFDERGANEAGFPWEKENARINPAYFDMADLRIQWLVRSGLTPCVLGSWGYYLPILSTPKMKQHWRNMIARWGCYPVVWCLAGEAAAPYYLSTDREKEKHQQIAEWTEIGRYVRKTDPYHRLVTIHPMEIGRDEVLDESVLDFNMLQTGHSGAITVGNTVAKVAQEYQKRSTMPVVVGEVNYEGIRHATQDEVQRHLFWIEVLSGVAGHTYGANGIWQVNTRSKPFGASPGGYNWGETPWEDAYRLPGSSQLGLSLRFLERYEWWRFEPHQDWVKPGGTAEKTGNAFAAGIPGKVRLIYLYDSPTATTVEGFEPGISYKAFFWNPRNGEQRDLGEIKPDAKGSWKIATRPTMDDWLLVCFTEEAESKKRIVDSKNLHLEFDLTAQINQLPLEVILKCLPLISQIPLHPL